MPLLGRFPPPKSRSSFFLCVHIAEITDLCIFHACIFGRRKIFVCTFKTCFIPWIVHVNVRQDRQQGLRAIIAEAVPKMLVYQSKGSLMSSAEAVRAEQPGWQEWWTMLHYGKTWWRREAWGEGSFVLEKNVAFGCIQTNQTINSACPAVGMSKIFSSVIWKELLLHRCPQRLVTGFTLGAFPH